MPSEKFWGPHGLQTHLGKHGQENEQWRPGLFIIKDNSMVVVEREKNTPMEWYKDPKNIYRCFIDRWYNCHYRAMGEGWSFQ